MSKSSNVTKLILLLLTLVFGPWTLDAAVTMTALTSGSDTSLSATYVTSSVTIHANRLAVASFQYARDAGSSGSGAVTSTGATWHQVTSTLNYHTAATPTRSIKMFYTMVGSDQTSAITLSLGSGNSQDGAAWSVVEFAGVQLGGTDGSAAVVQFDGASGGSGAQQVTCTLPAFADPTNNVAFGAFGKSSSGGFTADPGFTGIHDVSYATPSNELFTEWRIGEDLTVKATWTGGADCGCQAIEIAAGGPALGVQILSVLQED